MKKKSFICFILGFFVFTALYSKDSNYYFSSSLGKGGYAIIEYEGTVKEVNVAKEIEFAISHFKKEGRVQVCKKLTKLEMFLIQSALQEYDCLKNEVYSLFIYESENSKEALLLFVTINSDRNDYQWTGIQVFE